MALCRCCGDGGAAVTVVRVAPGQSVVQGSPRRRATAA
ncbi:hypothetical protein KCH_16580 [Kitasatospora cheerisanensis KCTC 2395]|uniref:Uncharacterized protein n=1 Tax=Kitasatospora cheerisanensis KCTC 2395 TaxID=1348663 RepID=A0A066YZ96_9ACTN|nr:hypothetical protein KCH_16580 [Kitasatospora cheerisanensis KCTC 2395]